MLSDRRVEVLPPRPPFDSGPIEVARRWPRALPLALLSSGEVTGSPEPRWSRWSILAAPTKWVLVDAADEDPLRTLGAILDTGSGRPARTPAALPFAGGWLALLSYELGRAIEPTARRSDRRTPPRGFRWPQAALARCERALIHDAVERRWWSAAPRGALPLEREITGDAPADSAPTARSDDRSPEVGSAWSIGRPKTTIPRDDWLNAVRTLVDAIWAGDLFQGNLTRLLHTTIRGDVRSCALDALRSAAPRHGAYLELPDGARVLSFSPELFLSGCIGEGRCTESEAESGRGAALGSGSGSSSGSGCEGGNDLIPAPGTIRTRPMKGTRPADACAAALLESAKDAAELDMIIDLMRNDLGRLCRPGTVVLREPRHVEAHPTVLQAVATIEGRLRAGVGAAEILRATFPPGSVTGAPKVRAMQVIEELEPLARGPYCGAVGYFADDGPFALSVAIRTLAIEPADADARASEAFYGVGCGIVAESDPEAEWQESLDKAALIERLADGALDRRTGG
ncbi:MAG TPA: anthranilate synthase component I family protein [Phycisphaerales bacterium]|nr:anthranilate synthase component I family protein [Phycisphaerales bacterium]HMP36151.1 anthranilate synthase component I family protein [Phycisphaerales bacterium]